MKNDAILPFTRAIATLVILFLVLAFGILFFLPDRTGAWMISLDPRWTAWRTILEGIFIAYSLIFVAAAMNPADFNVGIFNWYTALMGLMLITIFVFYWKMESQRKKANQ